MKIQLAHFKDLMFPFLTDCKRAGFCKRKKPQLPQFKRYKYACFTT